MSLSNLVLDMMFSSNPFAQFASSIHVFPPPNSILDTEKNDLFINHFNNHNNPFVSGDCCLHPYSPSFTTSKQDSGGFERLVLEQCDDEHNHELGSEVSPSKKKKASKKDHHSKIHTAQGPRDRRVRLSIDVARKFFFLQDLLGFDKASKTLDWLFTKSKIPIDALVQGQKHSSPSTVTDESQVFFREKAESDEQDKEQKKKSKSRCAEGKRKKTTRICKSEIPLNQSRAEARARARERTKEKLHIKKLDDEYKKVNGDSCCCCPGSPSYLKLQSSYWSAIESRNNHNDRFGETVMEGNISMLHSYQHNLDVSIDSTSKFTDLPSFTVAHEQQSSIGEL